MKKFWLEIPLHILLWLFSLWMLNQSFAFETQDIFFIDGRRHEIVSRNYLLISLLMFTLAGKMIAAYGNAFWALPRFLKNRNLLQLAAKLLLLLGAGGLAEVVAIHYISKTDPNISLAGWVRIWQLNLLLYCLYFGISVAYVMGKNWQRNERLRRQLQQEKLAAELNFLKSQINPHFLFNTLNNLFALAERHRDPELAQGIAGLAELMRYMLYDCRAERVLLEKEAQFIEALIAMQYLRLGRDDDVTIAFELEGEPGGRQIAPLLLLPFVENAFKHGVRINAPSFVKIRLRIRDDQLDFQVTNSSFGQAANIHDTHSGIGLENVVRRLALIYPQRHQLEIREQAGSFAVHLALVLS